MTRLSVIVRRPGEPETIAWRTVSVQQAFDKARYYMQPRSPAHHPWCGAAHARVVRDGEELLRLEEPQAVPHG